LVRRSRLSIEQLDALFQLPSPYAFLAAPSIVQRASYLILVSLVYYSLAIVSIFAPGALSVKTYTSPPSQGVSFYNYSWQYLWGFYGAALSATALVSLIAIILAYRHGAPSAIGFSQFLIMTRNPTLAQIAENAPLGAYQLVEDVRKVNLRFGKLGMRYGNNNEMVGFAVDDDEIVPLQKPVAKELW
jgi:hypothetical protein